MLTTILREIWGAGIEGWYDVLRRHIDVLICGGRPNDVCMTIIRYHLAMGIDLLGEIRD